MPPVRGRTSSAPEPERAAAARPLAEYDEKRDFTRTPEPPGTPRTGEGPLTFVVQKHRATRLHYDVRLEWDGVMPSWAVPKGPSSRIGDRHLAVHVEDHPLDYASFEGRIPKGEYGAGEVIVWDAGTYSPDEGGLSFHDRAEAERRMREGLAAGKLSVTFRGCKLKGSYALVRTNKVEGGREQWLILKHRDEAASDHDLTADDRSVRTGLRIEDLQRGVLPSPDAHVTPVQPLALRGAKPSAFPASVEPMQADLRDTPFADARWRFEPKLDGMRVLALLRDDEVRLVSRRGLDAAERFPAIARAVGRQPASSLILDGEIVALDERGVPSFELLQERMHLSGPTGIAAAEVRVPVLYYAFDLLHLDGVDLRGVPLDDRLETLARVLMPTAEVRLLEAFDADGVTAYEVAQQHGLEGIVAKRRDSVYESGRRSRAWAKVKARTSDEFVVGGYAAGEGGRAHTFGSLLVGQFEADGGLRYATHVGSGFTDRTLAELRTRLDGLRVDASPFAEAPPKDGHGAPTWVRPELVVEVEYVQRTRDGRLRAPVFRRVRDDRDASEIVEGASQPSASVEVHATVSPRREPRRDEGPRPSLDLAVHEVLEQLASPRKALTLAVEGHELKLTNLDKVLWPATADSAALTKRDLLTYYVRMAPWLLPHLRDRPVTMTRYPNGIEGSFFYQKHVEQVPPFAETISAYSDTNSGDQEFILCNNLSTLLWLGQMADVALHTSLARVGPEPDAFHLPETYEGSKAAIEASRLNYPDFLLFDLDPYTYAGTERAGEEPELNRAAWEQVVRVARWLKELLDGASLASFIKTSGATGLHVYVPVVRQYDYAAIRGLADTFGGFLQRAHPQDVTIEWNVAKRAGKVFFDHNQNARFKNLAAPYSPRAKPGGPVSMPIRWEELGEVYPADFTMRTAPERVARAGDVWADILRAKHDLRALIEPDALAPPGTREGGQTG
jgi:bifunctional non-homologous end joining protein LigD